MSKLEDRFWWFVLVVIIAAAVFFVDKVFDYAEQGMGGMGT